LLLATGWRHVQAADAQGAHLLLERIIAMLWKLTHRARRAFEPTQYLAPFEK
jgi:hypothetical protein